MPTPPLSAADTKPPAPGHARANVGRSVCVILAAAAFAAQVALVAAKPGKYGWDFRAYYYAPRAYAAGLDPYRPQDLRTVAGAFAHEDAFFGFRYPPVALYLFRPLSRLPYAAAFYAWLALKLAAAGALLYLWRDWAPDPTRPPITPAGAGGRRLAPYFVLLVAFGFNGALFNDFRSGNLAVLETVLLFVAFAAFARGRFMAFGLSVVAGAIFKLLPVALLGLLPFARGRRRFRALAVSAGAFAAVHGIAFVRMPELSRTFLANNAAELPSYNRGHLDANLMRLLYDAAQLACRPGPPAAPGADPDRERAAMNLTRPLYALVACGVAGVTAYALVRRCRAPDACDDAAAGAPPTAPAPLDVPALGCLAYALVLPRWPEYAFVLLLAPVYFAFASIRFRPARLTLFALALLPTHYVSRFVLHRSDLAPPSRWWLLPWEYSNYAIVACAWVALARRMIVRRPRHRARVNFAFFVELFPHFQ